jgi:hypothetical protein
MIMRTALFAAAFAVPLLLSGATPSMADVDVNIGVGGGIGVPHPYIYGDPYYDDYPYRRRGRLSCYEAKQLLRDRGYRRVVTIECRGRMYTFEASRRGRRGLFNVNSRTGGVSRQY